MSGQVLTNLRPRIGGAIGDSADARLEYPAQIGSVTLQFFEWPILICWQRGGGVDGGGERGRHLASQIGEQRAEVVVVLVENLTLEGNSGPNTAQHLADGEAKA